MAPTLRQSAGNAVGSGQSRACRVSFTTPTVQGNLLVVIAVTTSGSATLGIQAGFTLVRQRAEGNLQVAVWYCENAPALSTIDVTTNVDRSLQVRVLEYSGAAQSGSLDQVTVLTGTGNYPRTGTTGNTAQADSIVVAAVANQFASTTQAGFSGALTRLVEQVSPQTWGLFSSDTDDLRSRLTVHHSIATSIAQFALQALLASIRAWIAILICFKGGSTGPVRMSAKTSDRTMRHYGTGVLTVFGPLVAVSLTTNGRTPTSLALAKQARIGPFNWQYRFGGWTGLLVGDSTPYQVESHEGLEGWELRTSDDELPRSDGALRGVDLQAKRQMLWKIKLGSDEAGVATQQLDVDTSLHTLYRALIPQRDEDWELIWRHPGRPLRMVRCRPVNLIRELGWADTVLQEQPFTLVATDPRHYSAFLHQVRLTAVPASQLSNPVTTGVVNVGNSFAYPKIRIDGPSSGSPVTRIELVNASYDVRFVFEGALTKGSTLIGDMEARATGAPRSVVTIDGQSKYAAWQHPRETFRLGPGDNGLYLLTTPTGAPVTCTLDYRDTWSG